MNRYIIGSLAFCFMSIVYDEDGQFDVSDDGIFANQLEEDTELSLAIEKLPQRQMAIAKLILCGAPYKQIASRVGISEDSVKQFARRIKRHFSALPKL